jgi:hypothetical protein
MPVNNVFAIDKETGVTTHAKDAFRNRAYVCADDVCGQGVILHRGKIRAPHWQHKCTEGGNTCPTKNGGETVEHYDAKHHIAANLHAYRFRESYCPRCSICDEISYDTGHTARVEGVITGSRRRADVLVRDKNGNAIVSIEVFHSHRVGAAKLNELNALNIAVIEVDADKVNYVMNHTKNKGMVFYMDTTDCRGIVCLPCEKIMLEERQRIMAYNEKMRVAKAKADEELRVQLEPARIAKEKAEEELRESKRVQLEQAEEELRILRAQAREELRIRNEARRRIAKTQAVITDKEKLRRKRIADEEIEDAKRLKTKRYAERMNGWWRNEVTERVPDPPVPKTMKSFFLNPKLHGP